MSAQNLPWVYLVVGLIKLVLMMILNLLLQLAIEKVVWVIGLLTFPTIKIIIGSVVENLCRQGVGILQKWLLVMVYMVLVLVHTTSPPRKLFLKEELFSN